MCTADSRGLLGDDHGGGGVHREGVLGDEGNDVEIGIGDLDGNLVAGAVAVGAVAGRDAGAVGVGGGDGESVSVDARKDLVIEVGFESAVRGAACANGAGGRHSLELIAATIAVDDGVARGV